MLAPVGAYVCIMRAPVGALCVWALGRKPAFVTRILHFRGRIMSALRVPLLKHCACITRAPVGALCVVSHGIMRLGFLWEARIVHEDSVFHGKRYQERNFDPHPHLPNTLPVHIITTRNIHHHHHHCQLHHHHHHHTKPNMQCMLSLTYCSKATLQYCNPHTDS